MSLDITILRHFYASDLGMQVQSVLNEAFKERDIFAKAQNIVAMGYALPYLESLLGQNKRVFAFMPQRQGAVAWPNREENVSCLVQEDMLPLADESIDLFFLIHIVEFSQNIESLLSEIWRILTPRGEVILIVPNRKGLWARFDHTPFGHGVPYSRTQLQFLLNESAFKLVNDWDSLHFAPSDKRLWRFVALCQKYFARLKLPYFGGVLIVHARKDIYRLLSVRAKLFPKIVFSELALKTA